MTRKERRNRQRIAEKQQEPASEVKAQPAATAGNKENRESRADSPIVKSLKYLGKLIAFLVASLGFASAWLALLPRVTAVGMESLNPADPFTARFILRNDGALAINSVSVGCSLGNVFYIDSNSVVDDTFVLLPQIQHMEVGEQSTISCPWSSVDASKAPVGKADIAISISFRSDYTWWHVSRAYRFVTVTDSQGHLHWTPQPVSGYHSLFSDSQTTRPSKK
jgi:hypothetical protein